jgi:catechol 2,3-dioxygenase-like lactoylglutathione lyase family enzyme
MQTISVGVHSWAASPTGGTAATGSIDIFVVLSIAARSPARTTVTWSLSVNTGGRSSIKASHAELEPCPQCEPRIRKIAFAIDADKFPEAIVELKGNGADLSATEDTGIAYSVFFHDPDGHLLEITTFSASSGGLHLHLWNSALP